MLTIHVRITDALTKRPTPARLRVSGADGTTYPPLGRLAVFPTGRGEAVGGHLWLGRAAFASTDGSCEIKLPAGVPLRVQIAKGPEYEPIDREVVLGAGQMALRFELTRWADPAADGWLSGDSRVHFLDPHTAWLEAAAEGVAVVNVLARTAPYLAHDGNTYPLVPQLAAFSGQEPALDRDGHAVVVNTLNTHPTLGRVGLLHAHRTVFPLAFGGADGTDDWSLTDWCRQCHRKNGLTVWADAFRPDAGLPGGEALAAAVLGEINAVEFDARPRAQPFLPWYYRLLDAGLPLPLAGGSGKDDNKIPVGAMRTYAKADPAEPRRHAAWADAVRAGRTYVTNGPLLSFAVDGHGPGETVAASDRPMTVRATAESVGPFERLEVVAGGAVVASAPAAPTGTRHAATIECEYTPADSGWLAARCVGGKGSFLHPARPAFAHTSPVYLRHPLPRRPAAVAALTRCIEQTKDWAETQGVYADANWKRHLLALCDEAAGKLAGGLP